ncbi:chaperone protein dnaJ 11, chloroplastic [Macadamia integrifolia]|uniref:chaperone protein dnaJ 11, chloroplastic n=1 Tax=Macadamia integrifolia TaxID=60698 RepID=UPI001C5335D8|nr:chaperone protein dnaJ 11, chloroplastic [Macadamia integrifolia]
MFTSCAIVTGTGIPFLSGNRLSSAGTTRSSSSGRMSFTGASNPIPSWITIEAFADSATNTRSRRRVEEMKPTPPPAGNLYEVLRVKENASQVEIKTAYRSLAKLYHPDAATSDSDSRDFIEIHKAYSTLSDPTARARYDLCIAARRRSTSSSFSAASSFVVGGTRTRRWETDQCW